MTPKTLHQLFERSCDKDSFAPALSWKANAHSYAQVESAANQIANRLLREGIQRGERIGLFLDKSPAAVAALYGILKSGAAYVPLDVRSPIKRISHILGDCAIRALITSSQRLAQLSADPAFAGLRQASSIAIITLDSDFPTSAELDSSNDRPNIAVNENDLAYILYTSGSTGVPKGVMLSHRAGLSFVTWAAEYFGLSANDRVSSHAPFHFDLSTFDLFSTAAAGACVCLIPSNIMLFPHSVAEWMASEKISVWYSAPSALTQLLLRGGLEQMAFPNLRHVLFAGEVFPTKYLKQLQALLPQVACHNLYGPSETNVCTVWSVPSTPLAGEDAIPIGRACAALEVMALNESGQLAQVDEVGELYVSGPGLMLGYWGQPEKTEAVLGAHPLRPEGQEKAYRTGDLVKLSADGNYLFLGRRDHQVKSRGYRIELGEVESALLGHPAVAEAAVLAIADDEAGNLLHAYVAFKEGPLLNELELATFCRKTLPPYMVPAQFHILQSLPLNANGKIDRARLRDANS